MLEQRNTRVDILAILLTAFTIFVGISLFTYDAADPIGELYAPFNQLYQPDVLVFPQNETVQNGCGYLGALTADVMFSGIGLSSYVVLIGMVALGIALFYQQNIQAIWSRSIGWMLVLPGLATLIQIVAPQMTSAPVIGSGGFVGAMMTEFLTAKFAFGGALIVAASVFFAGLLMWTDYWILRWIGWLGIALVASITYLLPDQMSERLYAFVNRDRKQKAGTLRESDLDKVSQELAEKTDEEEEEYELEDDEEPEWAAGKGEAAEDDGEYEDEDEYEDDDELEEDSAPVSIPLMIKTAAKKALMPKKKKEEAATDEALAEEESDQETRVHTEPHFSLKKAKPADERQQVIESLNAASEFRETDDYDLPSIELLTPSEGISLDDQKREAVRKGKILEKTFENFGLDIKVVDYETGPVITQFEIQLASGLRLAKVTGLADDLAIALRAPSVRIVAPIPGKNTVGVEVPNDKRQVVRLREVIEDSTDSMRKMKIPLYLGKNVAGDPMVADLADLPHLLIAGRTGTGKSVCLNAIISSILMTRRPDEVRMLMIDPKMVELSGYARLPHLMHPVVTDMRKAEAILAWAVDKMEERYRLLAKAGVRHVTSYNLLTEDELIDRLKPITAEEREAIPQNLPFIVIVADEMADLMMTAGKEVESHIIRLAQKSRAVGIHLILATQKPTVDVITGLIKSNLPARISFQVASRTDSRVVLDEMGAEKLLGNGDMLFLWPGTSMLLRGQGTYLTDQEIQSVTDSVSTGEQNFVHELINLKVTDGDSETEQRIKDRDELYHRAVETVIEGNRGSISLLQKNLGIGYGRAARLIDYMEEDGVVGPYAGSKSREILMTLADWQHLIGGGSDDAAADSGSIAIEPAPVSEPVIETPPAVVEAPDSIAKQDPDPIVEESPEPEANILSIAQSADPVSEVVNQTASEVESELEDHFGVQVPFEIHDDVEEEVEYETEEDEDEEDAESLSEGAEEDEYEDEEDDYEYEYEYVDGEGDEEELEDDEEYEIVYEYVDDDEEEDSDAE